MQDAWHILKWMWFAVSVFFVVLQGVALIRLHGEAKRRSCGILVVIALLAALKRGAWVVFRNPIAFRLATVVVSLAEGIAALVLLWMLISTKTDDGVVRSTKNEPIQSLKLS